MTTNKKLYRDVKNGKISGVCAGLSDYLDIDVTVVRIIMLLLLFTSIGIWAYIIMIFIVDPKPADIDKPEEPEIFEDYDDPFAKYDKK